LTQNGNTLYVLNASGGSNISGFQIDGHGLLIPIDGSTALLSGANIGGSSISFSPNGSTIVAIERGTGKLDTFPISSSEIPGSPTFTPSSGVAPFASFFTSSGILLVAEAGSSSVSSYTLSGDSLTEVTSSLPTGFSTTCWVAASPDGKFAYASNPGSSEISVLSIAPSGALAVVGSGATADGAAPLDISVTPDGKYLYALTTGAGTISVFSIGSDGSLTLLGAQPSIPAATGQNGIAAL
jgi:6-phosphogluconolactonase (cycloisomerase 2 family)